MRNQGQSVAEEPFQTEGDLPRMRASGEFESTGRSERVWPFLGGGFVSIRLAGRLIRDSMVFAETDPTRNRTPSNRIPGRLWSP